MSRVAPMSIQSAARILDNAYKMRLQDLARYTRFAASRHAPNTYTDLVSEYAHGDGVVHVSTLHCDRSIYAATGDPEGNVRFRMHHDYLHLYCGLDFTLADECQVAMLQWNDLVTLRAVGEQHPILHMYSQDERDFVFSVFFADTVEQSMHFARYGEFPVNQFEFVRLKLRQRGWTGERLYA